MQLTTLIIVQVWDKENNNKKKNVGCILPTLKGDDYKDEEKLVFC